MRVNWDRGLSVTAIVISLVAAGGTVWQARIAEMARLDVLRLAEDRPVLHVSGVRLESPKPNRYALSLSLKNTGKGAAHSVRVQWGSWLQVPDAPGGGELNNSGYETVASFLGEGKEVAVGPLNALLYPAHDRVTLGILIRYYREDHKEYVLPLCYEYAVNTEDTESLRLIATNCEIGMN
jgi:hypothetical protein